MRLERRGSASAFRRRQGYNPVAGALLSGASLLASACGEAPYRGEWEVVDYRRPGVSVLGDLEAQARLGSRLVIGPDSASLDGQSCAIGEFSRQTLAVRSLEMAYDLSSGELRLPQESVEVVDLECVSGGLDFGERLIRPGRDTLLAPWEGIFLLLERRDS